MRHYEEFLSYVLTGIGYMAVISLVAACAYGFVMALSLAVGAVMR